ncbi:hypothetical protein AVEN_156417-1 [Araneus ventricosus]|uniref:Peptidase A2 domain-containing protein n=1 Tax=Araneus ventricosus TaxID=182803 RepID=A0A4Y2VKV7_ARAVE|nr:hypothetical protein AVEN_156417-1 [Araneus ventricosus]
MKELNNGRVTDEVLKTLFLQRLPLSKQQILSDSEDDLESLVHIADKLGETMTSASVIGEVLTRPSLSMLEPKCEESTNQVQRLSKELSRQKSRYRSSKSRPRTCSPAHTNMKKYRYHARFADKARKCVKPCSFSENFKIRQTQRPLADDGKGFSRLFIYKRNSKLKFLMDSGAACSVSPVSSANLSKCVPDANFNLYEANISVIRTYDIEHLTLDLGLRLTFPWTFFIADVSDFMERFDLLIDIKKRKLIDKLVCLKVNSKT